MPAPPPQPGDRAPGFALRSQHGETVRLDELLAGGDGTTVVVLFYPWAWSGVCGSELRELQQRHEELPPGVAVVAVSADAMYTLRAFGDAEGFTFPLLSDFWPHGEVARAYGVFDDQLGVATRGTFVVDPSGVVRWSVHSGLAEARSLDDLLAALTGVAGR